MKNVEKIMNETIQEVTKLEEILTCPAFVKKAFGKVIGGRCTLTGQSFINPSYTCYAIYDPQLRSYVSQCGQFEFDTFLRLKE